MKVTLDVNQQSALATALQQMDGYEALAGEARVLRLQYQLGGAARRALVKNMAALRASLTSFEEADRAIGREIWPDLPMGAIVNREDDPAAFARYEQEREVLLQSKDELDLQTFSEKTIYDDNEMPLFVITTLEEFGLVETT